MVQYIVFINLIGFFTMAADKYKAKHRKWRIAESTIWFISIIGGAIGTTVGMHCSATKRNIVPFVTDCRLLLPSKQ